MAASSAHATELRRSALSACLAIACIGPASVPAVASSSRQAKTEDGLHDWPEQMNDRCHTSGLTLSIDGVDVGAGNLVGTFRFSNGLGEPCTMYGYPGAELLDDDGQPLPTQVLPGGGWMESQPGPSLVVLPAGGSAIFRMHWEQVPVGRETTCPQAAQLAVTPPDEDEPLVVSATIRACGGGRLEMGAVQAAPDQTK